MKLLEIIKKLFNRRKRLVLNDDDDRSGETARVSSLPPRGKRKLKKQAQAKTGGKGQ